MDRHQQILQEMVCWNGLVTFTQKDFKKQWVNNCWVKKKKFWLNSQKKLTTKTTSHKYLEAGNDSLSACPTFIYFILISKMHCLSTMRQKTTGWFGVIQHNLNFLNLVICNNSWELSSFWSNFKATKERPICTIQYTLHMNIINNLWDESHR